MKHDYNTAVTANTVQTHHIGFVQAHEFGGVGFIEKVVAEQVDNSDAEWNVLVDGSAVFTSTQSVAVSDAAEEFIPDNDPSRYIQGGTADVALDVTASASFADELRVGVLVEND